MSMRKIPDSQKKDSIALFIRELEWHTDYHYKLRKIDSDCVFCKKPESYGLTYERVMEAYSEPDD